MCIVGVKLPRVLSCRAGWSRERSPSDRPAARQHPAAACESQATACDIEISLDMLWIGVNCIFKENVFLSGVPDYFDRNKILSGYDLSHYQVPHCIRVFFYFVWFVFIHHNFQFYFKLCTYCNILDIYLS